MKHMSGKKYWKSLRDQANDPGFRNRSANEFPQGASEHSPTDMDRRTFLGVMGAALALSGVTLSGCIRKPVQKILPYSKRPEDLIPGKPLYFATTSRFGNAVTGLLVESHEGRPTKIEGNPQHPNSLGRTTPWAQASILDLYDPDRSRSVLHNGKTSSWDEFYTFLDQHLSTLLSTQGAGLSLLTEYLPSPTFRQTLKDFQRRFPKAQIYMQDESYPQQVFTGAALIGAPQSTPVYDFTKAQVVLSLDADFLTTEGDSIRHAEAFISQRRVTSTREGMNRLYVVEPTFSNTGAMADHRLRLAGSKVSVFLTEIMTELARVGMPVPTGAETVFVILRKIAETRSGASKEWISELAKDLMRNPKRSLIIAGNRQPAWVHALSTLLNTALRNVGQTVDFYQDLGAPEHKTLDQLVHSIKSGSTQTLIMLGTNPVYTSPADSHFQDVLKTVPTSIHLSSHVDETSKLASWHIPRGHYLEAWGDFVASDGTTSLQQPLISPLYESLSDLEVLARLTYPEKHNAYELIKSTWSTQFIFKDGFEKTWKRSLHDGVIHVSLTRPVSRPTQWSNLTPILTDAHRQMAVVDSTSTNNLEINFVLDSKVYDGRYANNAWLQELPDPMSKLTWDNAAHISAKTARSLECKTGDVISIEYSGKRLYIPTHVSPGVADNCIIIALGYGRTDGGKIATGVGVNANRIRLSSHPFIAPGAKITKSGNTYPLASTQEHSSMEGRPLVREATLKEFARDPNFTKKSEVMPAEKIKSLYTEPNKRDGQQWGMTIDLNTCIGCNACTLACQAENNIPVVGKKEVLNGREMHWIRIDRYYAGSSGDPQAVYQPVGCQQCENAPCETVCPVAATTHNPEGLNDMAYNRCIGTRYCSNNCPYKVRRFNYFNYTKRNHTDNTTLKMQSNPDVTVRFRGVMEKCTYCVQRINAAKIEAHKNGSDHVRDGQIVPACAQACPTHAIVFGDINDPNSQVSQQKKQSTRYDLLAELNTKPRTSYLAKLRNPNPELVQS